MIIKYSNPRIYNGVGGLLNNITSPLKLYSIGGNSYDC